MDLDRYPAHLRSGIAALEPDPAFGDIHASLSTPTDEGGLTRRRFIQAAMVTGGAAAVTVGPWSKIAAATAPLSDGDPILVVIQLGGGNDGLNTVIPVTDPAYLRLRPRTSEAAGSHALGVGGLALHPALGRLAARYRAGKVAIVRGVGNVERDRSHFTAMATWMAGTTGGDRRTGWIGRYLDGLPDATEGFRGITLDGAVPLHMLGARSEVSALGTHGPFGSDRTGGSDVALFEYAERLGIGAGRGRLGDAVAEANRLSFSRARDVAPAFADPALSESPSLVEQLHRAALLVNANIGAKVLSATIESFDTHRDQRWMHNRLLADLDAAIERFYAVLAPVWADQVVIMTFSEFGRRAADNGSGTDHGTAAPHFVIGDRVRGGLHGTQPSLTDLDERGDLAVTVDFRSVYASVLGGWLGVDPAPVLGGTYPQLGLFRSRPTPYKGKALARDTRFAPFPDPGRFIDQMYIDFRDITPSAATRDLWVRRVLGPSWTINSTMERFFTGSEYYKPGIPIQRLALNLTGAPASFDDVERWRVRHRSHGWAGVVDELVNHPTFRARYSRLWGRTLVTRLHQDLTGMPPSSSLLSAWSTSGSIEDDAVAFVAAVSETSAAKAHNRHQAIAASVASGMLRRTPEASSVRTWGARLAAGTSLQSVLRSHLRSAEYAARFA